MLKSQICHKIKEEMQKLRDFEDYIENDFKFSSDEKEDEYFLFDLYKNVEKSGVIQTDLGSKIWLREQKMRTNDDSCKYFW